MALYNRYVPNGHGSFDRQRMPTPPPRPQETPRSPAPPKPRPPEPSRPVPPPSAPQKSPLPEQLDTGDLLMLLILLLILHDGQEDPMTLLLTLGAFYLFQ